MLIHWAQRRTEMLLPYPKIFNYLHNFVSSVITIASIIASSTITNWGRCFMAERVPNVYTFTYLMKYAKHGHKILHT